MTLTTFTNILHTLPTVRRHTLFIVAFVYPSILVSSWPTGTLHNWLSEIALLLYMMANHSLGSGVGFRFEQLRIWQPIPLVPGLLQQHYLFAVIVMMLVSMLSIPVAVYAGFSIAMTFSVAFVLCAAGFFSRIFTLLNTPLLFWGGMCLMGITLSGWMGTIGFLGAKNAAEPWIFGQLTIPIAVVVSAGLFAWAYVRFKHALIRRSLPSGPFDIFAGFFESSTLRRCLLIGPERMANAPAASVGAAIVVVLVPLVSLAGLHMAGVALPGWAIFIGFAVPVWYVITSPTTYYTANYNQLSRLWLVGIGWNRRQFAWYLVRHTFYHCCRTTIFIAVGIAGLMLFSETFHITSLPLSVALSPLSSMVMMAFVLYSSSHLDVGAKTMVLRLFIVLLGPPALIFVQYQIASMLAAGIGIVPLLMFIGLAVLCALFSVANLSRMPLTGFVAKEQHDSDQYINQVKP